MEKKRLRHPMCQWMAGLGILGAVWVLAACSGADPVIPSGLRIPFQPESAHSGQWQDVDATVRYRYTTLDAPAGKIQMSGGVFARTKLDHLTLFVHFLDGGGRILGTAQLYSSGYRKGAVGGEFHRTVDLPPGTDALSFYAAAAHDPGRR